MSSVPEYTSGGLEPRITLLRRRPNFGLETDSCRRVATRRDRRACLSDSRDRLGQQVAYLTRDGMQCRIIDRLHRGHRVNRADLAPPATSRRITLQGSIAPTRGSMPMA
ncbi:hypothetical protein HNQ95_000739 [Aminobacter ciceronei]|uniref:Transposase n=1 Tax=Aminobacter ciceronei TaxID=150723 RepID=A0ABR6C137_9HYPH|nr:hypothetical protein [Aminobacter ciceronei]MBA9018471.1 hypothetical protein [Aminobacter ciceronei]